nr:galactokinase [Anaerolineae bacterium]
MDTKQFHIRPPIDLISRFEATFRSYPDFVVRSPGRVDLIGTHTDYNEGWVLPAAINRYVWLAVKELPTPLITLYAESTGDWQPDTPQVVFRLTELEHKKTLGGDPLPEWATYAAGVAWSWQESGLATPGSTIMIKSDVPIGAGLSSSAAVEVAYAAAWAHITGWEIDRMELAQLCQKAENNYVGVPSGLMDQFACTFGKKGHVLLFDCRTHDWQPLAFPDTLAIIVADTGTRRTLINSHYEQRRAECEQAARIIQQYAPDVRALRDVTLELLAEHADEIPGPAYNRAQHIIAENERVLAAARALKAGEPAVLGTLMDESHISTRDLFEASGLALDAMWEASQGHPARLGGRGAGAGWAGCMVFLAEAEGAADFADYLSRRYNEATHQTPTIYALSTASGVQVFPSRGW